jgi:hypothetical protein
MISRLKRRLLAVLPRPLTLLLSGMKFALTGKNLRLNRRVMQSEGHQRMLALRLIAGYEHLRATPKPASINDHELSVYSQNGEDGILVHLFSTIGVHDHRFVEFGVGDGVQCNTANLSINFGWQGLLIEGDRRQAGNAARYYRRRASMAERVKVRNEMVTAENIDHILAEERIQGEIDLLSIDIDGNDYWVWRAISTIRPRVVIIEYNASFGKERAVVVPYEPSAVHRWLHPSGYYHGASLAALNRLATEKGYALVGCESAGVNAFFVRRDLLTEALETPTPEEAYFAHSVRTRHMSPEDQWRLVANMPLVGV